MLVGDATERASRGTAERVVGSVFLTMVPMGLRTHMRARRGAWRRPLLARRMRPPGWTDHDDSDPGISLLQLLAYLTVLLLAYRVARWYWHRRWP